MQTKKILSALAFTAVAVNMVASVALAQQDSTGTQILNCDEPATTGFTDSSNADDFHVGLDGTRQIRSSNDTIEDPTLNSAYFDETITNDFSDDTDYLAIESNTSYVCANGINAVQLDVDAENFENGNPSEGLLTYGANHASGGTGADEDYYAMLSIVTSGVMSCTSPCTLAQGSVEGSNSTKQGTENFFANAGPNDKTLSGTFDSAAVLIDNLGAVHTVTLYTNDLGFDGSIVVPGLDFNLAMPANPQFTGTFTSEVTYTLS